MGAHRLPRGGVLDAAGKDRAREGAFCLPSCAVIQGLCGTKLASLANCVRCAATFMPITLHAALYTGVRSGRPCGGGVQPAAALVCVLFSAHPACCSCRVVGAGQASVSFLSAQSSAARVRPVKGSTHCPMARCATRGCAGARTFAACKRCVGPPPSSRSCLAARSRCARPEAGYSLAVMYVSSRAGLYA